MAVITISRELGSEGSSISRQVAQQLGYTFVDKHTIEGVLRQYGLVKFKDLYESTPRFWDLANATNLLIIAMLNETIQALAQRGKTVILGRGGFAVLGDYADVLHVRIQAPFAVRVERVMVRENLPDRQQAEQRVHENDEMRRKFIQLFYHKRWDAESHFSLVIDTGALSTELAVNQIVEAARALEQRDLAQAVTTQTIAVDSVLADAIDKVILA